MSERGTVTINGQLYDAVTGLPVSGRQHSAVSVSVPQQAPVTPVRPAVRASQSAHLHAHTQRSTTLNRQFTKKPTPVRTTITKHHASPAIAHRGVRPVASPHVRKFAPHPAGVSVKVAEAAPVQHPHVVKAHAQSAAKAAAAKKGQYPARHIQITSGATKNSAMAKAVANTHKQTKEHKPKFWQQRQRAAGIIAATFALVLLGGYFTYLNMPNLSVRVAAAQAGINASYPNYRPDGYALNGPIAYSDGRVSMNFKANGSDATFTVNQSKSSWNSDAVLDNYVSPRAGSSYMPYTERGLTIYTYSNDAAWVNGGILYTIEGDAPLSNDQIRRIATSLL